MTDEYKETVAFVTNLRSELNFALADLQLAIIMRDNLADEVDRLRARVAELEETNQWIPVEERLPEGRVEFVVHDRVCIGYHVPSVPQWTDEKGFYFHGNYYKNVTHWRPLPEPPK